MLEHEVGDVGARDQQDTGHAALQQNQESNDRLPEPWPRTGVLNWQYDRAAVCEVISRRSIALIREQSNRSLRLS